MADPKVNVRVTATDEASGVIGRARAALAGAAEDISKRFVITAGDVTRAFGAVGGFIKDSLDAFAESEQAINQLNAALSKLGPAGDAVSKSLQEQAAALQQTTAFSDDAIIANQALLANFTQNEDALHGATQAAVDFAAATGTDLRTAFLLFGKAAEGNTAALGRYGIVVDETAPKAEKLNQAIEKTTQLFGGQAQAAAAGYAGQLAQLKNTLNDVEEGYGKILVTLLNATKAQSDGKNILQGYAESLQITANALPGYIDRLSQTGDALHLMAVEMTQGTEAADKLSLAQGQGAIAAEAARVAAQKLAEEQKLAKQAAADAAKAAKELADAYTLLGASSIEQANNKALELTKSLALLKGELNAGHLTQEQYNIALAKFREEMDKSNPSVQTLRGALHALGVDSESNAEKIKTVNQALDALKILQQNGLVSAEDYAKAQANATAQLVALGDKATIAKEKIKDLANEAVADQERLAASFRDSSDAADELADSVEQAGEKASEAAQGWLEFESAQKSTPEEVLASAEQALRTAKTFGSFLTTIDGGGSLGAQQALERRVAAAREAVEAGGNGAGSTGPIQGGATGRLAGGTRTLNSTTGLR